MRRSIDLGKQSRAESPRKPMVGVVIVKDGALLGESFRGDYAEGVHAEAGLIRRLTDLGVDLSGASVFTTLEPCTRRNHPKIPCARRLIDTDVGAVYIGMYDPNPVIYRAGWKMLRDAGVKLFDYPDELRELIESDNATFIDIYKSGEGECGSAEFDFSRNDGRFTIRNGDLVIELRFGPRGPNSVWAYDDTQHVAELRYAATFDEIDNPGSYDWSRHAASAAEGQLVAFRSPQCYLLVKVTKVFAGPDRNHDHTAVHFDWEFRRR